MTSYGGGAAGIEIEDPLTLIVIDGAAAMNAGGTPE